MPWLKMLKGETPGRTFPLNKEVTVLGRDAACEIVLSDHGVSKRHAKITRKDDGFYIEDLHSTNGTKVGNQELTETSPLGRWRPDRDRRHSVRLLRDRLDDPGRPGCLIDE